MISLSLSELTCIIEVLTESEQSLDYDYSTMLNIGFTQNDLMAFKSIIRQLMAAPSLDEREFPEQSEVTLLRKLGGLSLVKLAMGIDEREFIPHMKNGMADEQQGLCLTYSAYLRYANSIKASDGSIRSWLLSNLTVEFTDGLQLQSIPITREESVAIPSSDHEAALVGAALLADRYQLITYDARSSLMSLICLRDQRAVTIEVRCLSSTLTNSHYDAFCVENDAKTTSFDKKRKVITFSDQIKKDLQ
ncbi:hypothetical protein [Vibrio aestuarianus]|uniref:Uncharacterized protein n=1 Tax=Vibrio aestuarianus TaxID=28171 RepID=A0ABM9FL68_9VIBR|nr:hypothetical protein [Vibrio aestuarianus]MDE1226707.1 hypothetical protein [Vibrio aestuarianus]MDE1255303.1 hypothetical protein [Vibrio aestuarianus]MDE1273087.1 hypothetical protein [Vibrio aestuarianus]MDE1294465.1 hypothetical protein [Vibrio aestuarianus]MDE1308596.1 hypothetical protein [Vibrio aestuarianus]